MSELTDKQMESLKTYHTVQGSKGNWDYNSYMRGMYNGMELMMAVIENREPVFKDAPEE